MGSTRGAAVRVFHQPVRVIGNNMKKTFQKFFGYFLIGVLGLMPIVIILQIVIAVEGLLRDFVLSIFGRYENFFIPIVLFIIAILFLTYFGYLLKQDKAHVWYYLEGLLNRIPVLGTIYRVTKKILNLF